MKIIVINSLATNNQGRKSSKIREIVLFMALSLINIYYQHEIEANGKFKKKINWRKILIEKVKISFLSHFFYLHYRCRYTN